MENKRKIKPIVICSLFVLAYIILHVITEMAEYYATERVQIWVDDILYRHVISLIIMIVIILVPYERLDYVCRYLGKKLKSGFTSMIIMAVLIYVGVVWYINNGIFLTHFQFYPRATVMSLLLVLTLIWMLIRSYEYISSDFWLYNFCYLLILVNGVILYYVFEVFYKALLMTVALYAAWMFCNFLMKRKYRTVALLLTMLCNGVAFNLAVFFSEREDEMDAWLYPYEKWNLDYSLEHLALKGHSLKVPADFPFEFLRNHPFMNTYTYLGLGALLLLFAVFILLIVELVISYKMLSRNRWMVLLFMFSIVAVNFLYVLMADLGFLPTAMNISFVNTYFYLPMIGIAIRLFITKPVPETIKEKYAYSEDSNVDEIDELEDFCQKHELDINTCKKIDVRIAQYLIYQEHRINALEEQIKVIRATDDSSKDSVEDMEDVEFKEATKDIPHSATELMQEIYNYYHVE